MTVLIAMLSLLVLAGFILLLSDIVSDLNKATSKKSDLKLEIESLRNQVSNLEKELDDKDAEIEARRLGLNWISKEDIQLEE